MGTTGQEPVAVLGIGAMGHGMAVSTLRAGIPTIVWNRGPAATEELGGPGAVWAQMSTIGVAGTEHVAAMVAAERPDVMLLDAPVSGSREPAEQGQLTIFASGPDQARPRVAALFDALGQRTIWVGEVGAGSRLKLVNNTLVALVAESVATSVALARRLGLATQTVVDALGGGPVVSPWEAAKLQRIAKGDFSAQFSLSLALKDVRLAPQAAGDDRLGVLASLADEWGQAVDQGLGDQDLTVVTRWLERQGGSR